MVIALTVLVGLALVTFFVTMFVCQSAGSGGDHEALLPLQEETARVAVAKGARK